MNIKDETKQRSFVSSMRSSRKGTFPRFSSRRTKFQTGFKRSEASICPSLSAKTNSLNRGHERKYSFNKTKLNLNCFPVNGDAQRSSAYDEAKKSGEDDMVEISLNLNVPNDVSETER